MERTTGFEPATPTFGKVLGSVSPMSPRLLTCAFVSRIEMARHQRVRLRRKGDRHASRCCIIIPPISLLATGGILIEMLREEELRKGADEWLVATC